MHVTGSTVYSLSHDFTATSTALTWHSWLGDRKEIWTPQKI